jgi:hypothetical protein
MVATTEGTVVPPVAEVPPVAVVEDVLVLSLLQEAATSSGTRKKNARRSGMGVSFVERGRVVASAQRATVALRETRGAP